MYYDELDNASSVGSALRWARNDSDLDEAQAAAVLIITRISNWRAMVNEVGNLAAQRNDPPQSAYGSLEWEDTSVAHDTAVMLAAAKREPKDSAAARDLRERVRRQVAWHLAFATTWRLCAHLASHRSGRQSVEAARLDELDAEAPPAITRTAEQQDTLLYHLGVIYRRLYDLADDLATLDLPMDLVHDASTRESEDLDRTVAILDAYADRPHAALRALALTPGALTASQADGSSSGRRVGPSAGLLRRLLLIDLLLSLAVIALTSIAYGVVVYDDTWGSLADWATAIGAGFTGQVAVKWAALPFYRSLRIRANREPASAPVPAAV